MKKSKVLKTLLVVAIVAVAGVAAWFTFGASKSEASNYYDCFKVIKFDNTELGWSEVYAYCWDSKGNAEVVKFEKSDANTFYGTVDSCAGMLFKNTPGKDNWDKQTVDLVPPYGPNTFVFKPTTTSGKIEGKFLCSDFSYVTVYYKNDSIKTPHIYFQVGDSKWSDNYGVKMTESTTKAGYYEATILVTDYKSVKCCFNNGDNSVAWDNNNTKDYTLEASKSKYYNYYTIDNGVVTAK